MTEEGSADDEGSGPASASTGGATNGGTGGEETGNGGVAAIERIRGGEDRDHYRFVVGLFLAAGVGNGLLILLGELLPGSGVTAVGLVGAAGLAVANATTVGVFGGLVAGAVAGVHFGGDPRDAGVLVGFAASVGVAAMVVVVFLFAAPFSVGASPGPFGGGSPDPARVAGSLVGVLVAVGVLAGLVAYVARDYAGR